jgi:hypothetical protein
MTAEFLDSVAFLPFLALIVAGVLYAVLNRR